ncbi:PH-like domain-containing protein [Specibacter sp. RAF43]|uniref:PH-like domain-containing protein n=1 Tax=Specibacter sp. RAF43 TaxID=3233057 RepID=UPI003F9BF031
MGERTLPVLLTLLLLVAVFALMGWGWRNKLRRQAGVSALPELPADLGPAVLRVPGQYVVTTAAGDWLERIAVHGLGIRTTAELAVHRAGVVLHRRGAADIFIARDALTEVGTQSGMAGKFVEKDGLVVLTWLLGGTPVDTGFRTRAAEAKRPLLAALAQLLPGSGDQERPDADINGKNK